MANTKKKLDRLFIDKLIYLYLIVFPFGQLLRQETQLFGLSFTIHPVDLIAITIFLLVIFSKKKIPIVAKYFFPFFIATVFSLLLSFNYFTFSQVIRGSFFLLRLFGYFGLFIALLNNPIKQIDKKLLMVILFVAIFGWIQYFIYPDLRWLRNFGWDDHHYRLAGTFLDPGYTGLLLTFGAIISLREFINRKKYTDIIYALFFLFSVAYTYSRASYLSLLMGIIVLLLLVNKRVKYVLLGLIAVFVVLIPILPRPHSSGVELERLYSIYHRIDNYKQTLSIWEKSPVFGVGFNNLCSARLKFGIKDSYISHSCSGSDSGILLILATTGVIGAITLLGGFIKTILIIPKTKFRITLIACLSALFVHSFFTNSMFYPWIMGTLSILLAVSVKPESVGKIKS